MARRTDTGFITKSLLVELLTDGAVRVLNIRNGNWVTVTQSPKGVKSFVSVGTFEKDQLERYARGLPHDP